MMADNGLSKATGSSVNSRDCWGFHWAALDCGFLYLWYKCYETSRLHSDRGDAKEKNFSFCTSLIGSRTPDVFREKQNSRSYL
jgi:hypothetical protein